MSNIGLCFKTYIDSNTSTQRIKIIQEFLNSLYLLEKKIKIVGVVDSPINNIILDIIYKHKKIHFIVLNNNYGISIATNVGIEYLINNMCDYIFCSDDDIIIKNKNVLDSYVNGLINNKMIHLGYYPTNLYPVKVEECQNNLKKIIHGFSGCFYVLSKECVDKFGYIPVFNGKYGHEHVYYTKIITNHQYDISNSNELVELNPLSINHVSNSNRTINNTQKFTIKKLMSNNKFWLSKIVDPLIFN